MGCAELYSGLSTLFLELWSFIPSSLQGRNPWDIGLF